jgi:hypothetical protein
MTNLDRLRGMTAFSRILASSGDCPCGLIRDEEGNHVHTPGCVWVDAQKLTSLAAAWRAERCSG